MTPEQQAKIDEALASMADLANMYVRYKCIELAISILGGGRTAENVIEYAKTLQEYIEKK